MDDDDVALLVVEGYKTLFETCEGKKDDRI